MPDPMPEAPHNQDTLDAQAQALVTNPSTEIDLDALAAEALDNLVADHASPAEQPAPPDAAPPAQDMSDLVQAVEKLLAEAAAPAPSPAPLPPDAKIETLDAHIADLADDVIAGEFADEQNQIKGQVGAPTPPPEAVEPPAAAAPATPPADPIEAAPAVPDIPVAPRPARPAPPIAKPITPATEPKPSRGVLTRLAPIATHALAVISSPLQNKSKKTRDFIGWVAIITLFNATCLWGYLLFFRSSTPPTVAKAVAKDDHAKKDDGHAAKDDGHGKTAEAKDSHGAKKPKEKKTAAKKPSKKDSKAQASQGGGH